MMINLKTLMKSALIGAVMAMAPLAANAITVNGQIDITGTVNLAGSDFSAGGNVDLNDPGNVAYVTGDFDTFVDAGNAATLTDISFGAPGAIWSVGNFTFTATSFANIVDGTTRSFTAFGVITGNGFDATNGTLQFTTQGGNLATASFSSTTVVPVPAAGLLLLTALGGLGVARRRRRKAA